MSLRLVQRDEARREIRIAALHYAQVGGTDLALRFLVDINTLFHRIRAFPQLGSARQAKRFGIPTLRQWAVPDFPYLLFTVETKDRIDVIRVIHKAQDLDAAFKRERGDQA